MKKNKRFEIARKLTGDEVEEWKFTQQLESLTDIITDVHQNRPLMSVRDILEMLSRASLLK